MELDKRIAKDKTYIDCFETELAKKFIGKECYLSNDVTSFANINNLYKAVLKEVDEEAINPYTLENTRWRHSSNFILPCEWVEERKPEKKYRPLTNTEFVDLFDSGKLRSIRLKDNSTKRLERLIITDIYVQGDYLYANLNSGDTGYGPAYFFSKCEYFDGKDWQPFGVIDEDKD